MLAQTETATISGTITDQSGAFVARADVMVTNEDTNIVAHTRTNGAGVYNVSGLKPGRYKVAVEKEGFKQVVVREITLNVQDVLNRNFSLQVGGTSETIQVEGNAANVNTIDATVSTVVDRNFAENLPLNGRSFQTLIQLTPGVVLTTSNFGDGGQFSVSGQRAAANYWMVDGVSANIGMSSTTIAGNGLAGSLGSFSAQGGTNSLVSVDALQEFRIQTSTYAPEFGRTPGGQISIVTRSGTNQFHGTLMDYFRNDVLDANDWFNGFTRPSQPKAEERQNDFGGTFNGPILKDKTFFFFSYEGLRLRLPQTALTTVPDASSTTGGLNSRDNAMPALHPFLNAFPMPNGPEVLAPCDPATDPSCPPTGQKPTGAAQLNASFSNSSTLDAYSIRIDHKLPSRLTLFGRYNYSPSEIVQRGQFGIFPLSTLTPNRITTQTATVGATWAISPIMANDLRFNYSKTRSDSYNHLDNFGGAIPLTTLPLPSPYTVQNAYLAFDIFSLTNGQLRVGKNTSNLQRQINIVDDVSLQKASHSLKFGVDFRRLTPLYGPPQYTQSAYFSDVGSAAAGTLLPFSTIVSATEVPLLFRNLGVFAQDTWRVVPRLTVTYGLRWDVDFAPSTTSGPAFPAAVNFKNLATLGLAPGGTAAFKTPYGNVAPRVGLAYQVSQSQDWGAVLRGGVGVFFDLATQEVGNTFQGSYPFGGSASVGGSFPIDPAAAAPPPITPANLASGALSAFDPNLNLPYTIEWNVAFEQAFYRQQTLSVSYIGSAGGRLIQTSFVFSPNPNVGAADLISNAGISDYNALQVQFQRRLSRGLQALASYTWSHSIDTASAGSYANASNTIVPTVNPNANRGSSDFDIRNAFSAALTYQIPSPEINVLTNSLLRGWSLQNIVQTRSAPPVNVSDALFVALFNGLTQVRPDVVPGQPFYLNGSQYPGGRAFNPAVLTDPPSDANGNPLRQGNLGRNALRGFGATQWDFAVHRDFPIRESLKLQFRAEMFNVLNHPNFGPPNGNFGVGGFGISTQMLAQSLSGGNVGGGGFSPLYQIGGPRSIQLALRLQF